MPRRSLLSLLLLSAAASWAARAGAEEVDDATRRAVIETPAPASSPDAAAPPPRLEAPGASGGSSTPQRAAAPEDTASEQSHPPPLHVEYAQYGMALTSTISVSPGATCTQAKPPCILGSGGGLVLRGGYRTPGPWYLGGAYEFTKMDSGNLYRLGIFQQVRAEVRYLVETGYRATPYATWGAGAMAYGNEWGIETGGALIFAGGGVEIEVSRVALIGLDIVYRPTLVAGWHDTAAIDRPTGIAQFFGIELQLELRSELGRR